MLVYTTKLQNTEGKPSPKKRFLMFYTTLKKNLFGVSDTCLSIQKKRLLKIVVLEPHTWESIGN